MEGQQAVLPEATQIRRAAANGRNATGPSRLATKSCIGLGLVAFPGVESGLGFRALGSSLMPCTPKHQLQEIKTLSLSQAFDVKPV